MKVMTIRQFSEAHPAFSESALRNLINDAEKNGIEMALRRLGKRIYISEQAFEAWLDSRSAAAAKAPKRERGTKAAA